ncbi:hypothetical protein BDW75DRAFT_68859 [Aspergillus navahoensis]
MLSKNPEFPRPRHCYNSPRSTLPPPKHQPPARSPAGVCVSTNAGMRPCSSLSSSQCQPQETIAPPHAYSETLRHDRTLNDLAPYLKEPGLVSRCDLRDNTRASNQSTVPILGRFCGGWSIISKCIWFG